jgi:hypothetical protein
MWYFRHNKCHQFIAFEIELEKLKSGMQQMWLHFFFLKTIDTSFLFQTAHAITPILHLLASS